MKTIAVILAAGQGTRMRSATPKVIHPMLGKPMAMYAIEAAQKATQTQPVVVIGHGGDEVCKALGKVAIYARQEPQLGTAHAVQIARSHLDKRADLVLILYADMPLLSAETLLELIQAQEKHAGPLTFLTVIGDDPRGFGRVIRDTQNRIKAIVEEAVASPDQLAVREYNLGVYCVNASWLWKALDEIKPSPKGEYYLTDLVEIAEKQGASIQAMTLEESEETIGINTREHLAQAVAVLRARVNRNWMLDGVTLVDPLTTYIETGVSIGRDTVIMPNTYLQGDTIIGEASSIGPNTIVRDSLVGNHCEIFASIIEGAHLDNHVSIGPFCHLRKGARLASGVHLGNFGEVKNSYLGPGTKMGHFSYIGDATIGSNVNIGAGTITCNYDGYTKNPTEIADDVFIGSDTMLVAPVKLGEGAVTGAGAVVTKDVPPYTLAVGVPARAIRKLERRE
jgi:bifunctional UDP-N-acetylglucosamine pyrophosphorylase/glucosamine-1-phosphate N-acetyltransferase